MDEVAGSSPAPPTRVAGSLAVVVEGPCHPGVFVENEPATSGGNVGGRESPRVVGGGIGGDSPAEEGAATSNSFRGPGCYRQMGVAATDEVCRFKSCGWVRGLFLLENEPATSGGMWGNGEWTLRSLRT